MNLKMFFLFVTDMNKKGRTHRRRTDDLWTYRASPKSKKAMTREKNFLSE